MEGKIHPNPIRHSLTQGLTLLILASNGVLSEWFRTAIARCVQNGGPAVKDPLHVQFTVFHVYLADEIAKRIPFNSGAC